MTINSRQKGKAGELELSHVLKARGYSARRGVQYSGGGDSPDVVGLPGIHIECKRVEAGNPYAWMRQANRDSSGTGNTPVVMHRRNNLPWLAILSLDDFLNLLERAQKWHLQEITEHKGRADADF